VLDSGILAGILCRKRRRWVVASNSDRLAARLNHRKCVFRIGIPVFDAVLQKLALYFVRRRPCSRVAFPFGNLGLAKAMDEYAVVPLI
jgi:hypothetical protein